MTHFKSFLIGVGAAFTVYYLTKKDAKGRSMLDDLLDNPKAFAKKAEAYAVADAIQIVKEGLS